MIAAVENKSFVKVEPMQGEGFWACVDINSYRNFKGTFQFSTGPCGIHNLGLCEERRA